jgi:hypothetical protein
MAVTAFGVIAASVHLDYPSSRIQRFVVAGRSEHDGARRPTVRWRLQRTQVESPVSGSFLSRSTVHEIAGGRGTAAITADR